MRKVRWLSLIVLLFAIVYFAGYNWKVWQTRDPLGPVIEMEEEEIQISIKDGSEALLRGVTAVDASDGDVTDSLVVESLSGFVEGNIRYVNYAAFDSNNHVTKASRKMVYTDYEPIRFSLSEPLRFAETSSGNRDILGNVHAEDCLDGDISDRIRFSEDSNVYVYSAGDYQAELQVTNSAGDTASLPVTVTIYDGAKENISPQIELSEYLVYTKAGNRLDPKSYLQSVIWRTEEYDLTDGQGTFCVDTSEMDPDQLAAFRAEQEENPSVSYDRFEILDSVDYQTPGVYEIRYSLEDNDENVGRVNLIVVVEEE